MLSEIGKSDGTTRRGKNSKDLNESRTALNRKIRSFHDSEIPIEQKIDHGSAQQTRRRHGVDRRNELPREGEGKGRLGPVAHHELGEGVRDGGGGQRRRNRARRAAAVVGEDEDGAGNASYPGSIPLVEE